MSKINLMKRDQRVTVNVNAKIVDVIRKRANTNGRTIAREVDVMLLEVIEKDQPQTPVDNGN